MEEKKLTREDIALRILCAAVSTCATEAPSKALTGISADLCNMAFKVADLFIQERDKKA